MQAAMEKYAHFTKTHFPTLGQYEAWAGADLMIKGLELAGRQPDPGGGHQGPSGSQVLQRERTVAGSINYSTIFGHDPAKVCAWVMKAKKTGFVPDLGEPGLRHGHTRDVDGRRVLVAH
jgi:hypothetical protein